MSIDPNNSHASYIGKSTGSNKRSVPIDRTVSSNWNQRVTAIKKTNIDPFLSFSCDIVSVILVFSYLKWVFGVDIRYKGLVECVLALFNRVELVPRAEGLPQVVVTRLHCAGNVVKTGGLVNSRSSL